MIDFVFSGIKGVITYIDDVLVHARSHKDQLQTLERALQRLRQYNLKLNASKSIFGADTVDYLGYTIKGSGICPCREKMADIQKFPAPKNHKQIRELVGLANYFRFLIRDFALYAG